VSATIRERKREERVAKKWRMRKVKRRETEKKKYLENNTEME